MNKHIYPLGSRNSKKDVLAIMEKLDLNALNILSIRCLDDPEDGPEDTVTLELKVPAAVRLSPHGWSCSCPEVCKHIEV